MQVPFIGEITEFYDHKAPAPIRKLIQDKSKREILDSSYPYSHRLTKTEYNTHMTKLQIELVKLQSHLQTCGDRIVVLFEGRDTAGKGGAIARLTQNLNPRLAPIVALPKPSNREANQWYFQRYVNHLPGGGEMTIFDRSWYNRGVVEKVFGFCTDQERQHFFKQLPQFEQMLIEDGIYLIKFWLTVGQAEQLNRMLQRESDPLKQWKLSWVDVKGLEKWEEYTEAINETLDQSNNPPWTIILADDKRRARISVIQKLLLTYPYAGRDLQAIGSIDDQICGGLELRNQYRSI
jgi:polyphosphate kinase